MITPPPAPETPVHVNLGFGLWLFLFSAVAFGVAGGFWLIEKLLSLQVQNSLGG